jgi:hypothetical protein
VSRRLRGKTGRRRATLRLRRTATPLGILGALRALAITKGGSSVARLRDVLRPGRERIALRVGIVVSVLALAGASCSNERCTCPEPQTPTSGRATIRAGFFTDEHGQDYFEAFSFRPGATVRVYVMFPFAVSDFSAGVLINGDGEGFGVFLEQANRDDVFSDVGGGPTEAEGRAVFEGLRCIPESADFERTATAMPYRVLVVKARDGRFGKILVMDMSLSDHAEAPECAGLGGYCGEVTFDWVFQPDGGTCFE